MIIIIEKPNNHLPNRNRMLIKKYNARDLQQVYILHFKMILKRMEKKRNLNSNFYDKKKRTFSTY